MIIMHKLVQFYGWKKLLSPLSRQPVIYSRTVSSPIVVNIQNRLEAKPQAPYTPSETVARSKWRRTWVELIKCTSASKILSIFCISLVIEMHLFKLLLMQQGTNEAYSSGNVM